METVCHSKDYDTIALWYNKTLFDEAGISYPDETWTWDTLKMQPKTDKDDGSQYGFCAGLHNQEGYYNLYIRMEGRSLQMTRNPDMMRKRL